MTDEQLKNILKQSLTQNDLERGIERQRRKGYRKRSVKKAIAMVACIAIVLTTGNLVDMHQRATQNEVKDKNFFTLSIMAEELREDHGVEISNEKGYSWGFSGSEDGKLHANVDFPILCDGKYIKSVTYKPNMGGFHLEGKKESEIMSSYTVEGKEREQGRVEFVGRFDVSKETYDLMWGANTQRLAEKDRFQNYARFFSKVFEDVEINCKVTFQDGSTQEKIIKITGSVGEAEDTKSVQPLIKYELK